MPTVSRSLISLRQNVIDWYILHHEAVPISMVGYLSSSLKTKIDKLDRLRISKHRNHNFIGTDIDTFIPLELSVIYFV